jgi:hypothetical protein
MTIPYRVHDSVNSTRFSCFLCRVVSSVHDISSVLWCPLRFLRKQFFWFQITMSATISTYTLFSVRLYSHLYLSGFMFYFCYCIQYYLWTTYGMSAHQHWYSGFLHQWSWPPRYRWNIVESGVKYHNPNIPLWTVNFNDKQC